MLKPGQVGRFTCPSAIDHGGSYDNYKQDSFEWLKEKTDLTYEFEVEECSPTPYALRKEPAARPLESNVCIMIVAAGINKPLALTVGAEDKYKGSSTYKAIGIYDVSVEKWDGEDSTNPYQQWMWSKEDNSLHTLAHASNGDTVMFEGGNNNLAAYKQTPALAKR